MLLGSDLLTLESLLALDVVLGASLLSLLFIGEQPKILHQLYFFFLNLGIWRLLLRILLLFIAIDAQ